MVCFFKQVDLQHTDPDTLTLSNGLITREFALAPNFGTVEYRSDYSTRSMLRTVTPEAAVTLDGQTYNIGGLSAASGTKHAYLNRSSLSLQADPNAFKYSKHSQSMPVAPFHWEPGLRASPKNANWPPKGLHLQVDFTAPPTVKLPQHKDVQVSLHYELYQGVPILAKWVSVSYSNASVVEPVRVNSVTVEYLATQKPYVPWSYGPMPAPWEHGNGITGSWLYVETSELHNSAIQWINDAQIAASPGADEPVLTCTAQPGVLLSNITSNSIYLTRYESFRAVELVTDSTDRERVALSRHRLTRLLNPQTQENPIFFHATNTTPAGFQQGVDQMVDVGFEMYIYSFGSGFNLENTDPNNLKQIKSNIDYAHSKGVEVGG